MLTRIRHTVVRPWIRRPTGVALAVALCAAVSTSTAFAQCGGSGGNGGSRGGGGAGTAGTGLASLGTGNGTFGLTGRGQNGNGFFSAPTEQMFQPAFQHIVDDNRQYVAERRALRAAKVEEARQRVAARREKPSRHRTVAVNTSQE